MKIRVLAPDSKIPNLPIMKLSTYHKRRGDSVDWYMHLVDYEDTDILYISKIFAFTPDPKYLPTNSEIIIGGTGYSELISRDYISFVDNDLNSKFIYRKNLPDEIESITELDYSLYPDCDYSLMLMSRGCIRKCKFCIVNAKEGNLYGIPHLQLNPKGKWIMVLDNNFFANPEWRNNLQLLKDTKQPVDFNSGIDLRILTEEMCSALSELKIKTIHCAWDNYNDKDIILPKIELLCKYIKPYKIMVYVLVGFDNSEIIDTDIERVLRLKQMGVNPFACGYMDFNNPKYKKSKSVIDFCRWVNMKSTFKSCTWEEYKK